MPPLPGEAMSKVKELAIKLSSYKVVPNGASFEATVQCLLDKGRMVKIMSEAIAQASQLIALVKQTGHVAWQDDEVIAERLISELEQVEQASSGKPSNLLKTLKETNKKALAEGYGKSHRPQ